MDLTTLQERLTAYGADTDGINKRFIGDAALYEKCFLELLKEPNIAMLDTAINSGDFDLAFECAHALKGISGNLGLTGFYDSICALVEALRVKNYKKATATYADVKEQYHRLEDLLSG